MNTQYVNKSIGSDSRKSRRQVHDFLNALFSKEDVIELRCIASSHGSGDGAGHVAARHWLKALEILQRHPSLAALNTTANIYFGVNPRKRIGDSRKDSIQVTRCVWADFDHVSEAEAAARWRVHLPKASIVVRSGTGIHAYWLLNQDHNIENIAARESFEQMLRGLYRDLGSDSVQDVTRILRLPGFDNVKSSRIPCELLHCDSSLRYPLSTFAKWEAAPPPKASRAPIKTFVFAEGRDIRRIRGLVRYLDRDVEDRSRRDFGVVLGLLTLGVSPEEIASMVEGKSKFLDGGEPYLQKTIENALRHLGR